MTASRGCWVPATTTLTRPSRAEPGDTGARVVPLHRRVRLRHLGVAAAVVGVLGLGGYFVGSTLPGGVSASLSAGAGDSGTSADSAAAGKAQEGVPLVAPEAGSGEVVVVMSGVDHAAARLEVTARELDDGTLDPIADLSAESPSLGPIATPFGARACADALGIPAERRHPRRRERGRRRLGGRPGRARRRRPHRLGGRPLLHHGQHRPHPWPGVAGLRPGPLPRGGSPGGA